MAKPVVGLLSHLKDYALDNKNIKSGICKLYFLFETKLSLVWIETEFIFYIL